MEVAEASLPPDVLETLRREAIAAYLGELALWHTTVAEVRGKKARRREWLSMMTGWAEVVVTAPPDWCPPLRGVG